MDPGEEPPLSLASASSSQALGKHSLVYKMCWLGFFLGGGYLGRGSPI